MIMTIGVQMTTSHKLYKVSANLDFSSSIEMITEDSAKAFNYFKYLKETYPQHEVKYEVLNKKEHEIESFENLYLTQPIQGE